MLGKYINEQICTDRLYKTRNGMFNKINYFDQIIINNRMLHKVFDTVWVQVVHIIKKELHGGI